MKAGLAAAAAALLAALAMGCDSSSDGPGPPAADRPVAPLAEASKPRAHRYVSPRGSDRNPGSRARPWRTLRYAAARVRPGVMVHVAAGRYAGPLKITRSGTARRPVRFVSNRRWRARISAHTGGSGSTVEILGDHVEFAGFDVSGGGAVGIEVEGTADVVAGNRVHDLRVPCVAGAGIAVGGGSQGYTQHDVLVTGNVVERIGAGPRDGSCRLLHGIYAAVPRVAVVNNIVQEAVGDGVTSWHAARDLIISNNLSLLNGGAGILVGSGDAGASAVGHVRSLVSNNIVYRNALYGITETSDGSHRVGPGNQYVHNLAFANRGGDQSSASGVGGLSTGEVVTGNLNADPLLTGLRYRPGADSPAVDAGTCAGATGRDLEGSARPQGEAVDIGPYELRSVPGRCG